MSRRILFALFKTVHFPTVKIIGHDFYRNIPRHFSCSKLLCKDSNLNLDNISDLTDYVNKQMFYHKPEDPTTKITTMNLLNDCQSAEDVLTLIQNMHRTNNLWNDELLEYFTTLVNITNSISDPIAREEVTRNVLNNEHFHVLLRRTMLYSHYMLSSDLVTFFDCAADLMIPLNSFVINHTIEVMKKRINDFFPADVATCHSALMKHDFGSVQMKALGRGLVMHLENMAKDEQFFVQVASDLRLTTVLKLTKIFGINASTDLRECFIKSIEKSMRMRREEEIEFDLEIAVKLLAALGNIKCNHKQLLKASVETVLCNSKQLNEDQKLLLQNSLKDFRNFVPEIEEDQLNYLLSSDFEQIETTCN